MLSIIIPSRDEPYLNATINDILNKASDEIEIIVNLEGKIPDFIRDKRVKYIITSDDSGMRGGINRGIKMSLGKYIMKADAHCAFAKGFDEVLIRDCRKDWLMIPRRYSLELKTWDRNLDRNIRDYHYLSYPESTDWGNAMYIIDWFGKRSDKMIDDTMTFQGSCWFAHKDYFLETVGELDSKHYSSFGCEQIEIGLKYWLKGGEVKVNKNTWYAHLHKNLAYYYGNKIFHKTYKKNPEAVAGRNWATRHWLRDEENGIIHKFSWLIEKFWPIPSWPEDKNLWTI